MFKKELEEELRLVKEELEARRIYGGYLSNVLFNLCYTSELSEENKRIAKSHIEEWDEIVNWENK